MAPRFLKAVGTQKYYWSFYEQLLVRLSCGAKIVIIYLKVVLLEFGFKLSVRFFLCSAYYVFFSRLVSEAGCGF